MHREEDENPACRPGGEPATKGAQPNEGTGVQGRTSRAIARKVPVIEKVRWKSRASRTARSILTNSTREYQPGAQLVAG